MKTELVSHTVSSLYCTLSLLFIFTIPPCLARNTNSDVTTSIRKRDWLLQVEARVHSLTIERFCADFRNGKYYSHFTLIQNIAKLQILFETNAFWGKMHVESLVLLFLFHLHGPSCGLVYLHISVLEQFTWLGSHVLGLCLPG